ncbi:luciferase [Intrasporangium oryzae NRRL B-24470]|uniref:Luciferase n=1 Tax=Intrasporangium oryzae NRRL B-24470 TaxID=1386089 RepID=W9GB47_9MICO|nr:LLM class flavin-dependent oxidoreductase [Intrasporangium oryzae]EWT02452.1 luciferase [Intrasporangium oryzae NRRL B-24470]
MGRPAGTAEPRLPDPALVVLVGPAGAGKTTWSAQRYRPAEVVSSDALRAVVGSGTADLDASVDAFAILEQVVAARLARRLTTVVDTLGTDAARRRRWLEQARGAGLPAVAVVLDTPADVCRSRASQRDRPVPARVLASQVTAARAARSELSAEGWDEILVVDGSGSAVLEDTPGRPARAGARRTARPPDRAQSGTERGPRGLVLQLSRFPADEDLLGWLRAMATAAEDSGFAGIALMDHLIQIPQVGRAWDPVPEPWVTLGALAASTSTLWLGTLVTPVTFREPGIVAKAAATLSALSGGRVFVGVGAGWWEREHAGYRLALPPAKDRLDALEAAIETMRALWAPGTKPYAGQRVSLPETTCYPRPVREIPVIVGGGGARSLRIAAQLGDGCNVPSDEAGLAKAKTYLAEVARAGKNPDDALVTLLDLPVVGRDRDDVWARVERLRGGTAAATYAARHHAATVHEHAERLRSLVAGGVSTVFIAPPDLASPADVVALEPLAAALDSEPAARP